MTGSERIADQLAAGEATGTEAIPPCPWCGRRRHRHTVTGRLRCAHCDADPTLHDHRVEKGSEPTITQVQWAGKPAKPQGSGWTQRHSKITIGAISVLVTGVAGAALYTTIR